MIEAYKLERRDDGCWQIISDGFEQAIGHGHHAKRKALEAIDTLNGFVPGSWVLLKSRNKIHIMGEDQSDISMQQKFSKTRCNDLIDLSSASITHHRPTGIKICAHCEAAFKSLGGRYKNKEQLSFPLFKKKDME